MSLLVWLPLDRTSLNRGALGTDLNPVWTIQPQYELGKTGYVMREGECSWNEYQTEAVLHKTTSFAFWIKPTEEQVDTQLIFGNSDIGAGAGNRKFFLAQYPHAEDFHWWVMDDSSTMINGGTINSILPLNQWTHIAFISDSNKGTITVYINGKVKYNQTGVNFSGTFTYHTPTKVFKNCSKRLLCDFRVYDHVLTAKEVHELYKACIVHYNFEDLDGINEYRVWDLGDASGWLRYGHAERIKAAPTAIGSLGGSIPGTADTSYPISIEQFNPSFLTNCTFCFWFQATNFQNGLFYANDENGDHFLGAMNDTNTWNNGCHFEASYIDGLPRLGLIWDTNWHFYCLTGVNISTWTKIYINRHGDNCWNYRGNMCDFKIFATSLTPEEVMQEYKSRVHLLNGGQMAARSFKEDYSFIHGPICPEYMSAAGGAGFTSEVINDSVSFTGKVIKGTCTVAGSGPYIFPCPKSVLTHGHKYVMSFMAKSDNKTSFTYTYEASNGAEKPIKTDLTSKWQEYSLLITANTSSTYEALTFYCGWEVGENIYLCNFQAKDVTNAQVTATGHIRVNELTELSDITKIYNDGRISTAEAIEL